MLSVAERIGKQVLRAALRQTMKNLQGMRAAVLQHGEQVHEGDLYGSQGFIDELNARGRALEGLAFSTKPVALSDVPEWALPDVTANIDAIISRLINSAMVSDFAGGEAP